jgi:hypothetical protein
MPNFTRVKENFVCEYCRTNIIGNGYTNHCPQCLWSKHVDNNPGDRLNNCHGMMEPIGVGLDHGTYVINTKCQKCETIKKNIAHKQDNFEKIISLSSNIS